MGLIKANLAPTTASAFSMTDIEHQARTLLVRARAEADQILSQARRQAEAIQAAASREGRAAGVEQGRKDGREQGIAEGLQQGKAQALDEHRAKLTEAIAALTHAAGELNHRLERVDQTARDDLLRLSLAIAQRVIKVASRNDPAVIAANVAEAVRLTMDKSAVRIAIHPDQRATVDALLPQLKINWPTLRHVELIDDASIGAGGCRVSSATGEVDAAIDAQLDRIAAELYPSPERACHAEEA